MKLRDIKVCNLCRRRQIGWAKVEGKRRWFNVDDGELHSCDLQAPRLQIVP